jgi:hypothetical protein
MDYRMLMRQRIMFSTAPESKSLSEIRFLALWAAPSNLSKQGSGRFIWRGL